MRIGISIVDYGDPKWLKDCLDSIQFGKDELNPKTVLFDTTTLNCKTVNLGFTQGQNLNIKAYLRDPQPPDWIWLLNNDTKVPPETFQAIQKILPELDEKIGIVGFQVRSMENPDLIHHAGTIAAFPAGIHKSGSVKLNQFKERTYEKWVSFPSVLIRRDVFERIGLLDSNMFNFYSDSDYCYHARSAGFRVAYEPSFMVYHHIGQSQNPSIEQQKIITSDGIYFQNKWIQGKLFHDLEYELLPEIK